MFERIGTGWNLVQETWGVLWDDKKLLVFPLLSMLACLAVLASFAVPLWGSGYFDTLMDEQNPGNDVLGYVLLFAYYFANYFVIIFFNSALVACAIMRFEGQEPTLGDGIRAAGARLPQILAWSLVSASVGVILKMLESRLEYVGQIVAGLLGMAWSVTTYFVVPVLVVEKLGPIEATKRSLEILRKRWGEALAGYVGVELFAWGIAIVVLIPCIFAAVLGGMGIAQGNMLLAVLGFGSLVAILLIASAVIAALHGILLAAVYLYAVRGEVPSQFPKSTLEGAFGSK